MIPELTLSEFNALPEKKAVESLILCCGSNAWAEKIVKSRPYPSLQSLTKYSEIVWNSLPQSEWLSAFKHHPKIGDLDALKKKFASTAAWAQKEQGSVTSASEALLKTFALENEAYEKRHGFIFIVCATGKTVEEMLGFLQARIDNDTHTEMKNAGIEQAKITRLRLEKMIHEN